MRFEQREDAPRALLDDGRVLRRAADNRHAPDLTRAEHRRRIEDRCAPAPLQPVEGEPFAHLLLVALAEPAIVEHRLGAPLVREILQQVREEGRGRIVGHDGALAMARSSSKIIGVESLCQLPSGILDHGNDRRLHMLEHAVVAHLHLPPDIRQAAIAQDRAHLHRIGRAEPAIDGVDAHVAMPRAAAQQHRALEARLRGDSARRDSPGSCVMFRKASREG